MRRIFLIGYMCSGKTTLGRALAKYLGMPFYDLDEEIEREAGLKISEIFERHGEDQFRRLEAEMLSRMCSQDSAIVACGGGTPCREGAMEKMNAAGTTVWLQPSTERIIQRMLEGKSTRPLLSSLDTPEEMEKYYTASMEKRAPYYSKAQHRFSTTYLDSPEEIRATVKEFTRQYADSLGAAEASTPIHKP